MTAHAKNRAALTTQAENAVMVFQVCSLDRWPYEWIVPERLAMPSERIIVEGDLEAGTKYRCFGYRPDCYVEWGLVMLESDPNCQRSLAYWLQIQYAFYASTKKSDDKRVANLRRRLQTEGTAALSMPFVDDEPSLEDFSIGTFNDPFHRHYELCEDKPEPCTVLFVSGPTGLEWINAASIPNGEDFDFVAAEVFSYRPLIELPSYDSLLDRLRAYGAWFDRFNGET